MNWTLCPNIISDLTPAGKYISTMIIPKGTTKYNHEMLMDLEFGKILLKNFSDIVL